jgi:hypothetical protein
MDVPRQAGIEMNFHWFFRRWNGNASGFNQAAPMLGAASRSVDGAR